MLRVHAGLSRSVAIMAQREELGLKSVPADETVLCVFQATAKLAVELQLRARAELKEEEERRERVAANAQLLAMQQAHAAEMEALRVGDDVAWKAGTHVRSVSASTSCPCD